MFKAQDCIGFFEVYKFNSLLEMQDDQNSIIYKDFCAKGYHGILCSECENDYRIDNSYICERCDSMGIYVKGYSF